jgi:AbrB family looped-hinge helix DNA binding protein
MQTRVSTKGQIVLPGPLRRKLDIRAGNLLDIAVERDRIVLTQVRKPKYDARIVEDPVTGFTAIDLGPDAPILTSKMVRDLLTDFP